MSETARRPQLLVSVRDVTEARAALAGGADIIDIKEPSRGSLGRADEDVIQRVTAAVKQASPPTPVSAALGEVIEMTRDAVGQVSNLPLPPTAHVRRTDGRLKTCPTRPPAGLRFAKLGLSQLADDPDWVTRWLAVRKEWSRRCPERLRWIAVIYADALRAQSPPAERVIAAAQQTGCAGVLVDTFSKSNGRLFDWVSLQEVAMMSAHVKQRGLLFAVAGRLRSEDVPLLPTGVDILALRSAVCDAGNRLSRVSAERVRKFRRTLNQLGSMAATAEQSDVRSAD